MAAAVMLAAPAPANAQFGGLVKKAKKNITEKVTNKLGKDNQTTQDSQDTQGNNENSGNQTLNSANGQSNKVESYGRENDGIVIKHIENGRELATRTGTVESLDRTHPDLKTS